MLLLNPKVKLATFQACLDVVCNTGHTPHIQADTTHPDYRGIMASDPSGIVTLSISGSAVVNFFVAEEGIGFLYTEGGQKRGKAFIPMDALAGIYAKEDLSMVHAFPFKKMVDTEGEAAKVDTVKPKRKGFTPRLINGGKK